MTASLHRAEDVAAAIKARVLTRTKAQGAETDLGTKVYQGRRKIDDDMIPCCAIIEADDSTARTRSMRAEYDVEQRYVLFAYVLCDPDNPNVAAHAAIRDLKRAVLGGDGRLGGLVRQVTYVGRDIGPRADGAAFVVAAIEFTVSYVEHMDAP